MRSSTTGIYQNKWDVFCNWCSENNIKHPTKASIAQVADFFTWLFEAKQLEINTIKGYRAALGVPLKLSTKMDLTNNNIIGALFSNFTQERPVKAKEFPSWDLGVVLHYLSKPPFEPISKATPMNLNKKTAFLLLLASGARRRKYMLWTSLSHKASVTDPSY